LGVILAGLGRKYRENTGLIFVPLIIFLIFGELTEKFITSSSGLVTTIK